MKRHGFTLAEVLITLGIVGVIAALTMPTFVAKTSTAKIGPQLAKAVANFEEATKMILKDADTDFLNAAMVCPQGNSNCGDSQRVRLVEPVTRNFVTELERHMNGQGDPSGRGFTTTDGMLYTFDYEQWVPDPEEIDLPNATSTIPKEVKLNTELVYIDLNGQDTPPNRDGRDRFWFTIWNDGSLRPKGSFAWDGSTDDATWETMCPVGQIPTDATYCAGHIFANGLKVMYK